MAVSANTYSKLRLRLFFYVIMISVVTVAIFGSAGYWLDVQRDTKPLFLSLSLLVSFVLTNIVLFGKIKKWFDHLDEQPKGNAQS